MIVLLNKQLVDKLKVESLFLGMLFILSFILFKILFYKENLLVIIRMIFSLFFLIVIPGYFFMLYWADKINFKERFVLGIAAGIVFIGVISYYLGIFGLDVKYHFILLPLVISFILILINIFFKK